jgi:subtilase family serine protease
VGNYTVNATVWHPAHDVKAWAEADFSVLATPLPDLAVTSANIVRTGTLLEGENQRFSITVRNTGIANATDARINISMDGTLLNSSVRTINKNANVTISINWTATPGQHNISVHADPMNLIEESNEANNRAWSVFTVAARTIGIAVSMDRGTAEPGEPVWANGTVTLDGAPAPAGVQVNVSIEETDEFWLIDTGAGGQFSAAFNASTAEGNYTANATVQYPGYAIYAWADDAFTVAIPPTPDLVVTGADITIIGNLTNGTLLYFNIIIRNIGTDAANGVQVNVSIDGTLLSSVRQNIAAGGQRLINVSWSAVNGTYNLTVDVDLEGKVDELSETNNHAWKAFTVVPEEVPDDDDDDEAEEESDNTMLLALIIVIAIVAAIVGFMLMKKGKAPTSVTEETEPLP